MPRYDIWSWLTYECQFKDNDYYSCQEVIWGTQAKATYTSAHSFSRPNSCLHVLYNLLEAVEKAHNAGKLLSWWGQNCVGVCLYESLWRPQKQTTGPAGKELCVWSGGGGSRDANGGKAIGMIDSASGSLSAAPGLLSSLAFPPALSRSSGYCQHLVLLGS